MGYRLRDGLTFCVTGQRAIFLDVRADRYFGLRTEWDREFQAFFASGEAGPAMPALVEAGILIETDGVGDAIEPARVTRAVREFPIEPVSPLGRQSLHCIFAQFKAMLLLRTCPFGVVIREIEERSRLLDIKGKDASEQDWIAAVSAFASSTCLRPRDRHCLTSAIAFLHVAHKAGHKAKLVLGVSATPFSAHCWVQAGEYVLSDRLENIRPFEPILAI